MHCTFHALNNQLYWTIFWSPLSSIYASTVPGRQGLVLKQHITALPDHSLYSCWNYWSKQRKWQIKQAMLQYAQPALQYFHRARDRKEKALSVYRKRSKHTHSTMRWRSVEHNSALLLTFDELCRMSFGVGGKTYRFGSNRTPGSTAFGGAASKLKGQQTV